MIRFAARFVAPCAALLLAVAAHAAAQDAGVDAAAPVPPPPPAPRTLPAIPAPLAADFAQARPLFDAALRLRAPRMTDAVDPQKLNRRINQTLVPWLRDRMQAMTTMDLALTTAGARSPLHRAIAAALSALAWDDFATQLSGIAAPRTLRSDPTMRGIWQSVIYEQAEPFRQRAREAWRVCASSDDPTVAPWQAVCARRLAQLDPGDAGTASH